MRILSALAVTAALVLVGGAVTLAWAGHAWVRSHGFLVSCLLVVVILAVQWVTSWWRRRIPAGDWQPLPGGGFVAPRPPYAFHSSLAGLSVAVAVWALGLSLVAHNDIWQDAFLTIAAALFFAPHRPAELFVRRCAGRPELAVTPAGLVVEGWLRRWERIERVTIVKGVMSLEVTGRFPRRETVTVRADATTVPPARVVEVFDHYLRHAEDRASLADTRVCVPMTTLPPAEPPSLIG